MQQIRLCACGCGHATRIAKQTRKALGHKAGEPIKYINGHCHGSYPVHGMTETPEWNAWKNARDRCNRKKSQMYKSYGGRGIKFLFPTFGEFYREIGPRPSPNYSLDRRDNDGNYEPGNIRWATRSEQQKNKRKWRLTQQQRSEIAKRRLAGESGRALASEFGVCVQYIYQLGLRQERTHEFDR